MKKAMGARNIGIWLIDGSNSFAQEQDPQLLKQQSEVSSTDFIFANIGWHIVCRAFNEILKLDRAKYGSNDDYTIGDTIADEWQQRVDEVVAGTPDAWSLDKYINSVVCGFNPPYQMHSLGNRS